MYLIPSNISWLLSYFTFIAQDQPIARHIHLRESQGGYKEYLYWTVFSNASSEFYVKLKYK